MKLPLLIIVSLLIGCGGAVYQYDPQTHQTTLVRRLHREEDFIYFSIDSSLAEEKQGKRPSGGAKTWRESWERSIAAWRRYDHPEYEQYFLRRRKEMGLKDLSKL